MFLVGRSRPHRGSALSTPLIALCLLSTSCAERSDPSEAIVPTAQPTTITVFLGEAEFLGAGTDDGRADHGGAATGSEDPDPEAGLVSTESDDATAPGGPSADGESAVAPAGPTAALQANLTVFGTAYLSYDYRQVGDARAASIAAVATPELAAELAVPLPPDAQQKLVAEQRVVNAEYVSATAIDEDVYELTFMVTVIVGEGEVLVEPELRKLVVTVNANGLIANVI